MIAENPKPSLKKLLNNAVWGDPTCPIKFNKNLSLNEANSSIFFRNTRLFLQKLLDCHNEITATDGGNLNRAFVAVMFEEMELDEDDRMFIIHCNKVLNETDVYPLYTIRTVCQLAGLINRKSKRFLVARKYQDLLDDEKAGELYFLLFRIYCKKFHLKYMDRFPELRCIQETLDYSLYRLTKICDEYRTVEKLFDEIVLTKVKEEICKRSPSIRGIGWFLEAGIISPLMNFGLLEATYKKERYFSRIEKVRKSELFDKFLGWEV